MQTAVIGITTSEFNSKHDLPMVGATRPYVDSVLNAGGIPVLIPSGTPADQLTALAGSLQGILFSGGVDINPACYGAPDNDLVNEIDNARDALEIGLLKIAVETGLPFLGICRGHQLVNVALGGTLFEDIASLLPQAVRHDYYPDIPRTHMAHLINTEDGTQLAKILGAKTLSVNSLHHQSVRDIAPGLQPTVYSADGIVEGLELSGHPFGITVQWHPEWLQHLPPMQAIFQRFVEAAKETAAK